MTYLEKNGLKIFHFESLDLPGVTQAIFSRHGGLSQPPWSSLNLGGTVGDDRLIVKGNLDLLLNAVGYLPSSLAQVRQIHSANVILAQAPMDVVFEGDAMISNTPGLLLLMRFADCVPIMFFDPVKQAVAIAHAGWKGTVKQISFHTVRRMVQEFGTNPADLLAGIGPSIGPDHYEIGDDVIHEVKQVFPEDLDEVLISDGDGVKLDLWKANQISLRRAGVTKIEISGICTACCSADWFSHRGEQGKTGRFAAVVGLN